MRAPGPLLAARSSPAARQTGAPCRSPQRSPAVRACSVTWITHLRGCFPKRRSRISWYVSDLEAQEVFIYAYRSKKLVGTLDGIRAEGLCVDRKGDVWVTNDSSVGDHQVIEYAHGATTPLQTLDDPDGRVNGCAVNPVSGDLAVTNFWGPTERSGGVSIYPHGNGSPASYMDPNIYYYYYCGYDDKGDLFVPGLQLRQRDRLRGVARRRKRVYRYRAPGDDLSSRRRLMDGLYVAVGDQVAVKHNFESVIYQFAISGSSGTEAGTTILNGANEVAQFWLPRVGKGKKRQATRVIGPNGDGMNTLIWSYPIAGNPVKTYSGEQDPTGATLEYGQALAKGFAVPGGGRSPRRRNLRYENPDRACCRPLFHCGRLQDARAAQTASMGLLRRAVDPNPTLNSYTASAQLSATLHVLIPVHKNLSGTVYYLRPKRKIEFQNVSGELSRFKDLASQTPSYEQLAAQYTITPLADNGTISTYSAVPKKPGGRVKSITLTVTDATALVARAQWAYSNGGTLSFDQTYMNVGQYRLPAKANSRLAFRDTALTER